MRTEGISISFVPVRLDIGNNLKALNFWSHRMYIPGALRMCLLDGVVLKACIDSTYF
jgi:hypothetical protein